MGNRESDFTKNNAQLIAVAPEIYKALVSMLINDEIHQSKFGAGIISNVKQNEYKLIIGKAKDEKWNVIKEREK